MSILWKFFLKAYFRVFSLSVTTFLAILFILRFKEIARFSALSGNWTTTALFTLCQFPLILPIAIPISAFMASFLLMQRLSQTSELTAFRSCSFSFKSLFAPLFFASLFIALTNFWLSAEIAPFCYRKSKSMLLKKTSTNPLIFLQRQQLGKLKHSYLSVKIEDEGKKASNLFLLSYNARNERLNLLWASHLSIQNKDLMGEDVALITYYPTSLENFDSLVIENHAALATKAAHISQFLKKRHNRTEGAGLSFKKILLSYQLDKKKASLVEIFRRSSLAAAVFSFTLLGFAFGIENNRLPSRRATISALFLLFLLLVSYLATKEFKKVPLLAFSFTAMTHALIWGLSLLRMHKVNKGTL